MRKTIVKIEGMDCASDAVDIERSIKKIEGVSNVIVNYLMYEAFIECEDAVKEKQIKDAIRRAGYRVISIKLE